MWPCPTGGSDAGPNGRSFPDGAPAIEGIEDMVPRGKSSDHCRRHKQLQARDSSTDPGTRSLLVCLEGELVEGAAGSQFLLDGTILHLPTLLGNEPHSGNNGHVRHGIA
jgi:hypothetical protein